MHSITLHLDRDSVCAGDDVDPHAESFVLNIEHDTPDPLSSAIRTVLNSQNYLPSVAGSSTWIAHAMGRRFVFRHGSGTNDIREWTDVDPIGDSAEKFWQLHEIRVDIEYYLSNAIRRIVKQLRAGKKPDQLYGDQLYL